MSQPQSTILVLWDDHFDESIATLFITGLRKVGQRVKVIGLSGLQGRGASGLSLVADMTLSAAIPLLEQVSHIIIPCSAIGLRRIESDPRIMEFLKRAGDVRIQFVILGAELPTNTLLEQFYFQSQVIVCPVDMDISYFVKDLAGQVQL